MSVVYNFRSEYVTLRQTNIDEKLYFVYDIGLERKSQPKEAFCIR